MHDSSPNPSAAELAKYLEARGEISKPWMLHLLRLVKLKEAKSDMSWDEYLDSIKDAHADLMRFGASWRDGDQTISKHHNTSHEVIEPGSAEDR